MNSDNNDDQNLPDGWVLCTSKSNPGRKYYFNKKTGKSSWTNPLANEKDVEDQSPNKLKRDKKCELHFLCSPVKRKEELQKKTLKRKSDGNESCPIKKKQKQELSPEQNQHGSRKIVSPQKRKVEGPQKKPEERTNKIVSPVKPAQSKNLANNRLSNLREQLNAEVQSLKQAETKKSPMKNKLRISPKTPQLEPQSKISKTDLKSPVPTEIKPSSQSPSSDSLQSVPSPSQFFAANKILSSMKAQLPDGKYFNRLKPKDTFADIEQGICNQITEYPFMKHPATPPQFSEASKLVSAIKSKLSGKVTLKDISLKTYSSARERMEALRTRLSNDAVNEEVPVTDEEFLSQIELPPNEAMDIEESKETRQSISEYRQNVISSTEGSKDSHENVVLVVDTNIFIHELDVIKNVLNSHIKGYSEQPTLLVPWRVINELDRLKDNNNGNGAICKRARSAMDYLYKSLPENDRIKGQSLRDANSHIYPCESPDDEILNCCLQQVDRGKSVILLSNDKNLCSKATINGVRCIGLGELKPLLENKPPPTVDPDLYASVKHYESTMYHLLANILENEMRAKYNNLWQHVVCVRPPWALADVLHCLIKHWIAVFNDVFPRIEHLISDLKSTHLNIRAKDPNSLSQSEVSNFKELCVEIAKKCQIIPEYMELAKVTLERFQRKCVSERQDFSEMPVIDAFEGLWTVFSSYCSKLSSALKITHNLEDKIGGSEPLADLISKWPMFSSQIRELTLAMRGSLDADMSDPSMEEHLVQLEIVFKESLALSNMDSDAIGLITQGNLKAFCTNCRNMLQEALAKFTGLSELLEVCRNNIANCNQ